MAVSLLKIGKPIPAIEILIAAISLGIDLPLLTTDAHFMHIKSIKSDFNPRLDE